MSQLEQLLGSGTRPGLQDCLARYRAPGLTFTQRPKEMWAVQPESPMAPLNGDTLPTLEDRGPSQSREQADTSGCQADAVAVSQLTTEAEQRTQKNAAHRQRVAPPQETGCSGTCSQHENQGKGSSPPPLLSKQHGPRKALGSQTDTLAPLNCEEYQGQDPRQSRGPTGSHAPRRAGARAGSCG